MALTGWPEAEIKAFLDLQFHFQEIQWLENYPHASFALILCAGVPVGRLYLNRQPSDLRILEIALLPAYRQRGIGRAIFMELIAEAERTHCRLSLHVERHNPIRGFYERLGFQPICARGILFYMERPPRT
jgi:GNAT superfamily N-acetyltransferase